MKYFKLLSSITFVGLHNVFFVLLLKKKKKQYYNREGHVQKRTVFTLTEFIYTYMCVFLHITIYILCVRRLKRGTFVSRSIFFFFSPLQFYVPILLKDI